MQPDLFHDPEFHRRRLGHVRYIKSRRRRPGAQCRLGYSHRQLGLFAEMELQLIIMRAYA